MRKLPVAVTGARTPANELNEWNWVLQENWRKYWHLTNWNGGTGKPPDYHMRISHRGVGEGMQDTKPEWEFVVAPLQDGKERVIAIERIKKKKMEAFEEMKAFFKWHQLVFELMPPKLEEVKAQLKTLTRAELEKYKPVNEPEESEDFRTSISVVARQFNERAVEKAGWLERMTPAERKRYHEDRAATKVLSDAAIARGENMTEPETDKVVQQKTKEKPKKRAQVHTSKKKKKKKKAETTVSVVESSMPILPVLGEEGERSHERRKRNGGCKNAALETENARLQGK